MVGVILSQRVFSKSFFVTFEVTLSLHLLTSKALFSL